MEKKKNGNINKGAALIAICFVLLFCTLFIRFLYLEITKEVSGTALTAIAQEKWTNKETIQAQRGKIMDKNGNILAQDIPSYTMFAIVDPNYPNHVENPEETAEQLAPILGAPKQELEELLSETDRFQVEFGIYGRKLSQATKTEIESLDLSGIGFTREPDRYYPNQEFASHIIGFSAENPEAKRQEGLMGIEKSLNDYLTGKDGSVSFKTDQSGNKLPVPDEKLTKPEHGKNVYLTIDENVQLFVEQALDEVVSDYQPEWALAVAVDPKTGEILALGNRPDFNPNEKNVENYTNYAISSRFEPGSTMKIFTLAAAIEEGVYNGQEKFQSGRYKVEGGVIPDHNNGNGWGMITFDEGVRRSSNVAFSMLAKEKLGLNRFYQYLHKFGFNERTGIDLPNEVGSKLLENNVEIEMVSTSFGQGSAVTPIQQIQAATAIANNGIMMQPHVVKKIVDPETNEPLLENQPKTAGNPISPETADKVRDLLATVVTDGTGQRFAIEGYQMAGKTGTAQIPSPEGGYMTGWGNNIYSFIGMAPKDDPKLLLYVAIDRPKLADYEPGSVATSKLFTSIMQNSLQYLDISPREAEAENEGTRSPNLEVDDFTGQTLQKAKKQLEEQGFRVTAVGNNDSNVEAQIPKAGAEMMPGERIVLKADGKAVMPDLSDWSLADVFKLVEILDLDVDIKGSGYVVKQNIEAKETVRQGDHLKVQLLPPNAS